MRPRRSTPDQKIKWLAQNIHLAKNFRSEPQESQKRVFMAMKDAGLIARTTALVDTDVWGYMVMAEKRAMIKNGKQVASHRRSG